MTPERIPAQRPILSGGNDFGDEQTRAHGHGNKYQPFSYQDVQPILSEQIAAIHEQVQEMPDRLRGDRIVVQVKLHPNYLAASHFPSAIVNEADLTMIGTRAARGTLYSRRGEDKPESPTKVLLLAARDESIDRLSELLNQDEPESALADEFIRFEQISLPGRDRLTHLPAKGSISHFPPWEAVLHPAIGRNGTESSSALTRVTDKLQALVQDLGGELRIEYLRKVGGLSFVPILLDPEKIDEIGRFNPLRAIRPMPRLRRPPERRMRSIDTGDAAPTAPTDGPEPTHRIAVFDGGVDSTHPLLAPFVSEADLTSADPDDEYVAHGTLVTSALLYGQIDLSRPLESPRAHVDHFRVFPIPDDVHDGDADYWIVDRVVETLRKHPDRWRIANLSLGPANSAVNEFEDIDRFTAELDQLVADTGITVTVAVGNEGRETISTLGEDRVMAPSDGVNVLPVGACDATDPPEPVRAAYSCVGPGRPGLRVAPLGVSFGGCDAQHFMGAEPGGGYQSNCGTSFSAPLAARGLASLFTGVDYTTNLGRAMASHFAVSPNPHDLSSVGYGRFRDDYRPLLDCPEGSVTVVVQDQIERGITRAYPMPYPRGGLNGRVKSRWTVSFVSGTDPQDSVEYTQAGLEVVLRPNATAYTMSLRGSREKPIDVDLRTDAEKIRELANKGWELSTNPKTRSGKAIRSEQTLRDEGKWETVMRHEDGALARSLHMPSIWVTYYQRNEGQLVPKEAAATLDFTLVMTVESASASDLYELIRADSRFSVLTPLTTSVPVQT